MTLHSLQAYGKAFQLKVLGSLLTDRGFLLNVRDMLRDDLFDADAHKWIVMEIIKYFDIYHTSITMDVLKVELQKVENEVLKVAIREELRNSYAASQDDLDYVQREFTDFCRNQEMKAAILSSAEKLKNGDFEGIRASVEKALKAGLDKGIGHDYKKDIETRYREDYRPTIPTPWPAINQTISGGWGPGDLILIFGSPGGGKSWLCIGAAVEAVKLGYNVNYYTLELGEDYVGKRFDANLTGRDIDFLSQHREMVEDLVKDLPGNLIIKEYAPKTAGISTIKAHIQRCTDMGMKPDLVIIDYLDYVRPPSKSRYTDRKDEIDDVYVSAKSLAKELKIPVISPSQVNRSGAKDDVVEGDKAAGSYDKMMVADISFSLSRKKEDKVLGTGRFHLMKNRFGMDGITFNIKFDSSTGTMTVEGTSEESATTVVGNPSSGNSFSVDTQLLASFFGKGSTGFE